MPLDTLGTAWRSLQVPTWLLKNFLVAERSIGNRIRTIWTANQSSKYCLEALSAFGYFGERSDSLFKSPPGYSKTFWLLRGPSGIGSGPQIKVQSMYLQALSAFGYFGNSPTVFTSPHLVTQKLFGCIGNRIRPIWTAIKVQSMYLQALSAFEYIGNGLAVFTSPHLVTQKLFGC